MRKYTVPLLLLSTTLALANTSTLNHLRAKSVSEFKDNRNAVFERVDAYILRTGDLSITRADIQKYYGLTHHFWDNFAKEECDVDTRDRCVESSNKGMKLYFDSVAKKITLKNVLGSNPNTYVQQRYKNESNKEIDIASNNDTSKVLSIAAGSFVNTVKNILSNPSNVVSATPPSDTTKIWYKPDGYGNLELYKYKNGKWNFLGDKSRVFVNDATELEEITPCVIGVEAFVTTKNDKIDNYICNASSKWSKSSSSIDDDTLKSMQQIHGEIIDLSKLLDRTDQPENRYFGYARGSDVIVSGLMGSSNVKFNKAAKYWRSDISTPVSGIPSIYNSGTMSNKSAFVASNIDDLNNDHAGRDGDVAWLLNVNNLDYTSTSRYVGDAANPEAIKVNGVWQYYVPNLEVLIDKFSASLVDYTNPSKVFVAKVRDMTNSLFEYVPAHKDDSRGNLPYFRSSDRKIVVTEGDRSDLPLATNYTRLSLTATVGNDTKLTPSGINSQYRYHNSYFKKWSYSKVQPHTNNMVDARTFTSMTDIYNSQNANAILQNSYRDLPSGAFLTLKDKCYFDKATSAMISKSGYKIPYNKVLSNKKCDNITIVKYKYKNYAKAENLDDFIADATLPINYPVVYTDTKMRTKYLKRCADSRKTTYSSGKRVWSDRCFDVSSASVALTDGSREDLASPRSTSRLSVTRDLGREFKKTPNGIPYTADAKYKQWIYYTRGVTTNKMTDVTSCASRAECYSSGKTLIYWEGSSPAKLLTKQSNGLYKDANGNYLFAHYGNTSFTKNIDEALYAYYYEHKSYTKSNHRRVSDNKIWKKILVGTKPGKYKSTMKSRYYASDMNKKLCDSYKKGGYFATKYKNDHVDSGYDRINGLVEFGSKNAVWYSKNISFTPYMIITDYDDKIKDVLTDVCSPTVGYKSYWFNNKFYKGYISNRGYVTTKVKVYYAEKIYKYMWN